MTNLFTKMQPTLKQQVEGAKSKQKFAIHIFTGALNQLQESNAELETANAEINDELAMLSAMQDDIASDLAYNDRLIDNINGILK